MFEIVGREEELASLHAFIGDAPEGPAALVLEGEAGIGKSTLWLAGVEHARERGLRVLSSRPAEAERSLAHVGLGDLFDGRPRRRAACTGTAEAARARGGAPPRGGGRRDGRSAGARAGGSRRRCRLLAAKASRSRRDRRRAVARSTRRRALSRSRCEGSTRTTCSCCSPGGSSTERGRRASSRRSARRASSGCRWGRSASARSIGSCATGSAGPSRARHCSASTRDRAETRSSRWSWPAFSTSDVDPLQPLPVPETLEELVRARISGLPASTREALALASALGTPSEALLERAGVEADALEPAIAAHVIERENGTIRFTHPLLSSVLYRDLGDGAAERSRADRGSRRRPAPPRPSPRALEGRAGRRRRGACSTTPRGWRPIAARRPSRPSSPSRRSG